MLKNALVGIIPYLPSDLVVPGQRRSAVFSSSVVVQAESLAFNVLSAFELARECKGRCRKECESGELEGEFHVGCIRRSLRYCFSA